MIGLALGTTDGVVDGVLTLGLMMAHLIEKALGTVDGTLLGVKKW